MSTKRGSDREKELERLKALQNMEKKFLKGAYGDFFGEKGSKADGTGPDETKLSFGEDLDQEAEGREPVSKSASGKASGKGGSLDDRIDALEQKGREITSALSSRTDALKRANDALKEVRELLDNPLYDGMPSVTGAGADGKLFTGSAGPDPLDSAGKGAGNYGMPSVTGTGPAAQTAQAASAAQPDQKEKEPETDPMEELDKLIGLTKIKHDVKELMAFVKIQKMRSDGGLKSVPVSLHLVFTGNPGTGKTTVARILARLYKQIGVLSQGQLVEVDRSGLVAGYVGQTALKTAKKIEEARGGVLFIDEAYALARKDDTFGQEAIDTILKAMEDNRDNFVVIVAGYTGPMENFINSNPGLKSRFNKYIEFPDYTIDELMGIFEMNCKKYDYEAEDDVKAQIRAILVQRKLAARENFANAREVRNLFEEVITNQARRIAAMEDPGKEDLKKILLEDLEETAESDAKKTLQAAADKNAEKAEAPDAGAETEKTKVPETEANTEKTKVQETGASTEKTRTTDTGASEDGEKAEAPDEGANEDKTAETAKG